jgi:hypothetical protein
LRRILSFFGPDRLENWLFRAKIQILLQIGPQELDLLIERCIWPIVQAKILIDFEEIGDKIELRWLPICQISGLIAVED